MKKNKIMRFASLVLVLTLLSTCAISGTFAKYTTSATSQDEARVAYWGWNATTMDITGLFKDAYDTTVTGNSEVNELTNVIAPGTSGSASFAFAYAGEKAPEVAYTFEVSTTGSEIGESIENNTNIQWKLDNGEWGTWDTMITAIEALDGNTTNNQYNPGTLPTAFTTADDTHTISWQWLFATTAGEGQPAEQDATDTAMGNVTAADLAKVKVVVTVTATQVD